MSAIFASANTAEVALGAAVAKTVLRLTAPANHRVRVLNWSVSFDGISSTAEPVVVELIRYSSAGTMSSLTPSKLDGSVGETLQTTAAYTATSEPSISDYLKRVEVHPQGGYEFVFPEGQEPIMQGGGHIGIRCTAPAAVNVVASIGFEE